MSKNISNINWDNNIQSNYNNFIFHSGNNNNKDEFKEPEYKLTYKCFLQNTYHFKQEIERVWFVIKNFDILILIQNQGHYPCVSIKGTETWTTGNIFKGNFFGKYPFIAKVKSFVDFPEIKKIKWLFNINGNKYFTIKLELFKLTENNSTVLTRREKFEDEELKKEMENENNKCGNSHYTFEYIEKILEEKPINLLKYESCIISGKMLDIWNIVIDSEKLTNIAPNNKYLPNISIKDLKLGEKKDATIFCGDMIKNVYIYLKIKETKEGWNKWRIVCEISGKEPGKIPRHTVLFQLTKINEEECQLAFITKYHEPINNEEFEELSYRKKYVLISIKDYFENFFSPTET